MKDLTIDIISHIDDRTIESSWITLKNGIQATLDLNVPSKIIKKKNNLPWLNRKLKKMLKRKARLHQHAKRTGNFKEYRHFQNTANEHSDKQNGIILTKKRTTPNPSGTI